MVTLRSQKVQKEQSSEGHETSIEKVTSLKRKNINDHVPTRISTDRPAEIPQPKGLTFKLLPAEYGVIQERIHTSLYALVVQAILWNQTSGLKARPILFQLLALYPTPLDLSQAKQDDLATLLQPIGLHNTRAARLIGLATAWEAAPPCKERRYRRLHYPNHGCGADVKPSEVLDLNDEREGWEIAHLPGVGPYALDSYRIFHRDKMRGLEDVAGIEPEWKRVVSKDKDLSAYLKWKWAQEPRGEC